jgi:hypothetical protein
MPGFITLEDAKAHLVVLDDNDDDLIQDLIDAASKHAEAARAMSPRSARRPSSSTASRGTSSSAFARSTRTASRCSTSTATAMRSPSRTFASS